jgi:hypothetical protein
MNNGNEWYLNYSLHKCILQTDNRLVNSIKEISMQDESFIADDLERELQELQRQWGHDPSARWLLALDAAIRRFARVIDDLLAGRGA